MSGFGGVKQVFGLQQVTEVDPTSNQAISLSGQLNMVGTTAISFNSNGLINHDGSNLIVNPGSGYVYISDGLGGAADLSVGHIGLKNSAPPAASLLNSGTFSDSTVTQFLGGSITHTGSATTLRAMGITVINAGTATSPGGASFFFSQLGANPTPASTSSPALTGFIGQGGGINVQQTVAAGQTKTITMTGLEGRAPGDSLGHNGTGGTLNIYRTSILATNPTNFSGLVNVAANIRWALRATGDVQIDGTSSLRFGGSSTSQGTSLLTNNSTSQSITKNTGGVVETVSGCLFTSTASVTVANTAVETNLIGAGVGTVAIPANFFVAGKTIRVTVRGVYLATGGNTLELKVKLNATINATTAANVPAAVVVARGWELVCDLTCRTAGAGGTIMSAGMFRPSTTAVAGVQWDMENAAAAALDTTIVQTLTVTATWGGAAAGDSISQQTMMVEVLN
jgi:hypothetical protein